MFGSKASDALSRILSGVRGQGPFGRLVCGTVDLDNMDNVVRLAHHSGIKCDKQLPLKLAASIVDLGEQGEPIFNVAGCKLVDEWLQVRSELYHLLMLAKLDYVGKTMLVHAMRVAHQERSLETTNWWWTDSMLLDHLRALENQFVRETVIRWSVGDAWEFVGPVWLRGRAPKRPDVVAFGETVSLQLGRALFAYVIKDKRNRVIDVATEIGGQRENRKAGARVVVLALGGRDAGATPSDISGTGADLADGFEVFCRCLPGDHSRRTLDPTLRSATLMISDIRKGAV